MSTISKLYKKTPQEVIMREILFFILDTLERIGGRLDEWAERASNALFLLSMRLGRIIMDNLSEKNRVSNFLLVKILLRPMLFLIRIGIWIQMIKNAWIKLILNIIGTVLIFALFPPFTILLVAIWLFFIKH